MGKRGGKAISAKLSSFLIILEFSAAFDTQDTPDHPHESWNSYHGIMVVYFLPGEMLISGDGWDLHLFLADSPLVSHKTQDSVLFCFPSYLHSWLGYILCFFRSLIC